MTPSAVPIHSQTTLLPVYAVFPLSTAAAAVQKIGNRGHAAKLRSDAAGIFIQFDKPCVRQIAREACGHWDGGAGQIVQEAHFRIVQDFRTHVELLHRAGRAVDPNDRPPLFLRKVNHVRRAAQSLAGLSVPERDEQLTLLHRFDAAFVIAFRQFLAGAGDFHRQRLLEYAFRAGPCRFVKIFAELFLRQRQKNADRQIQFNAGLRKQQVSAGGGGRDAINNSRNFLDPLQEYFSYGGAALGFVRKFAMPGKSNGQGDGQVEGIPGRVAHEGHSDGKGAFPFTMIAFLNPYSIRKM